MTTKTKSPKNRIAENGAVTVEPVSLFSLDKLAIKVVGVTPLLCANPASMQPQIDETTRTTKAKTPSPAEACRSAAYFDSDGHCAFPNAALAGCILSAAELMKLKLGTGRFDPSAASVIQEALTFDFENRLVKLVHPETGEPLTEKDYEMDMQRAVNQNTGGAIVAIRPRFDCWSATFKMLVDTSNGNMMGVLRHHFATILSFAGSSVGLGAFRAYVQPKGKGAKRRMGGPFGKFHAAVVD